MQKQLERYTLPDLVNIFEETLNDLKRGAQPKIAAKAKKEGLKSYFVKVAKNGDVIFRTTSGTTPGKFWNQRIRFKDLKVAKKIQKSGKKLKSKDIMNLVIFGDILVYCDDLSFRYWGWEYIAWKRGYGLSKQTRFPKIRNPRLQYSVCKHLYNVFRVLPFYINTITGIYKKRGLI